MSNLITPTLLDSLDWYMKCPKTWKNKAYTDLYNKLNRIWTSNVHVEKGTELENEAFKYSNQQKGSKLFQQLCKDIQYGIFQHKCKKYIKVNDIEYCLYGKIDVLKPRQIIDIKTTMNYKGENNYLSKWQHKFYCLIKEISIFQYIVVEWTEDYQIKEIHYVDYLAQDFEKLKQNIIEKIIEFIGFLDIYPELKEAYHNKFNLF